MRTWDTPSTHTTNTAFTTARSFSHTVGGGSDRYIWCGIATEDFSTGGGAQTPSSVAYGGNALTLASIATVSSIQTAAIYSGQDSVCGSAGAHNMVITYAGEVDAIVAWAVSTDNMAQQVKEATGSVVQATSVSGGTSNITTVTNESLIIAVSSEDEGTTSGVTHSWNVGTEFGDLAIASVGGSMVRYEKATAGAQAMTLTLSQGVTRLCMVSAAYETINAATPVADAGADEAGTFGVSLNKTDMGGSDADSDIASALLESANGTLITVNVGSPGPTVTGNGTDSVLIEGDHADVLAALADVDFLYADPGWDSPYSSNPETDLLETITLTLTDDTAAEDSDTFTLTLTKAAGDGTASIVAAGLTLAELNTWIQSAIVTPITDSVDPQAIYVKVTSDSPASDSKVVPIAIQGLANTPPIAAAGPDQAVTVGDVVQLDGTGSSDADGDALTFSWTITQAPIGSAAAFSDDTIVNPTITPDLPGFYVFALFVHDGTETSDGDQVEVTASLAPGDVPLVAEELDAMFFPKSRVPLVAGDTRKSDGTVIPSPAIVWKYPKDLYDIAVDWSGRHVLPGGALSVAAVDVTITDPSIGSPDDVTDTILSAESVDGLVSIGTVQIGTIGKAYTVRHRATFDNGRFLNKYITLQIRNPRSDTHRLFKYPDEEFDVPLLWTGRAPRGATALGAIVVKAYDASDVDVTDDYLALIDGDSGKAVGTLSEKAFSVARITGGTGGESILLEFAQAFSNGRTFHEYAMLTVEVPPA